MTRFPRNGCPQACHSSLLRGSHEQVHHAVRKRREPGREAVAGFRSDVGRDAARMDERNDNLVVRWIRGQSILQLYCQDTLLQLGVAVDDERPKRLDERVPFVWIGF